MRWCATLVCATAVSLAAPALAADEAHGEKGELLAPMTQGLPAFIATLIVFGLVYMVLSKKAWPIIVKGLTEREAKIKAEIEAAELARRQSKEALEQYEKSLAEARAEAKRMLDETKAQQQSLAAELRASADRELSMMKDRARREIEIAKKAAIAEIYAEAGDLAARAASKILRREVSPADYQRLVDESLNELRAVNN